MIYPNSNSDYIEQRENENKSSKFSFLSFFIGFILGFFCSYGGIFIYTRKLAK